MSFTCHICPAIKKSDSIGDFPSVESKVLTARRFTPSLQLPGIHSSGYIKQLLLLVVVCVSTSKPTLFCSITSLSVVLALQGFLCKSEEDMEDLFHRLKQVSLGKTACDSLHHILTLVYIAIISLIVHPTSIQVSYREDFKRVLACDMHTPHSAVTVILS